MIDLIKAQGYRVFIRSLKDEHCFYTDGEKIGYAQWSALGTSVSSVHKPSQRVGTGFKISEAISPKTLEDALNCYCPNWHNTPSEVLKYKNWDSFHNSSEWNKKLFEI